MMNKMVEVFGFRLCNDKVLARKKSGDFCLC